MFTSFHPIMEPNLRWSFLSPTTKNPIKDHLGSQRKIDDRISQMKMIILSYRWVPTIQGFHSFHQNHPGLNKTPHPNHQSTPLLVTLQGIGLQRFIGDGILPPQGVVRREARARGGDLADFGHGKARYVDGMSWWRLVILGDSILELQKLGAGKSLGNLWRVWSCWLLSPGSDLDCLDLMN